MSTRRTEIIEATTNAATSEEFSPLGTVTITAGTITCCEGVKIQYTNDGVIWQDLKLNAVVQEISVDHSIITILGPGKFRCLKTETLVPVSVNIWESEASK